LESSATRDSPGGSLHQRWRLGGVAHRQTVKGVAEARAGRVDEVLQGGTVLEDELVGPGDDSRSPATGKSSVAEERMA
jgi:hypothetical protein